MNLHDHLRKLKTIMPREEYSRRSRLMIVGMPENRRARFTFKQFLFHNIELGSAIALTALLLVLGFGGFSAWKILSPFRLQSLDPAGLQAEAEAVHDIQVKLQGVTYVPLEEATSSARGLQTLTIRSKNGGASSTSASQGGSAFPSSTMNGATTTVDEALDLLLE